MAELKQNVTVDNKSYGPDYPQNGQPPEGSVPEEFYKEAEPTSHDLRFRADDFAVESGKQPFLSSAPVPDDVERPETAEAAANVAPRGRRQGRSDKPSE